MGIRIPVAERMEKYTDKRGPDDCWEWTAHKNSRGYGQIRVKGRTKRSHRVAWCLANGLIPPGMMVLHDCDNPSCVNPAHLHLGTAVDNMREKAERGRARSGRLMGEQNPNSKLTLCQVNHIRARYALGNIRQKTLAAEYGVSQTHVSEIVRHICW